MVRSTHWNVVRNTMRCARDALLSISAICRAISTEFQVPLSLNVRSKSMVRSTHWNVVRNTMRCARDALLSISAICRAISTEFQVPLSLNVRSTQHAA